MTETTAPELLLLLRAVRRLLALTACLLGLLVLGLGLGAWLALQQLDRLEARAVQQVEQWRRLTGELGQVAAQRQTGLSSGLVGESRATRTRLSALTERRRTLEGHPTDPLAKLDRVIDLNQLMADELLALLRHATDTQEAVGKSLRPLPKPKALSQPGSGP